MLSKKRKISSQSNQRRTKTANVAPIGDVFGGLRVYVLQAGLGKARSEIFKKQLLRNGGVLHDRIEEDTTHLVVDDGMDFDRVCRILKLDGPPPNAKIVKANWLANCFDEGTLLDSRRFELVRSVDSPPVPRLVKVNQDLLSVAGGGSGVVDIAQGRRVGDDDECSDDDDDRATAAKMPTSQDSSSSRSDVNCYVCSRPSTSKTNTDNVNKHITDKLKVLMQAYKNKKDQWREFGYKNAISAIEKLDTPLTTWEEAYSIDGVGKKLADKIWEIIQSGHLRKIDYVCQSEEAKALDLFNNIWGVGPTTAQEWVQLGYRSLEDVRSKAKLSRQQAVGLSLYDDLLERMPRSEAGQIEKVVAEAAHGEGPGLVATACGSYRRGKDTCGDVDVLITHPDGESHRGVLPSILDRLKSTGFLTHDLVRGEVNGEQVKYMGVCKLPGNDAKHRRLDLLVVPYSEYPCALLYFTGSDRFNRSLRLLAKNKGWSLNEHSLKTGVVRHGKDKIHSGTPLPVSSEKDVFRHLGLEYREPHERAW